jgi:type I restriction enzyme S subunit
VLLDRPEAVDALEQTILQLAVRGLLVPQDPTDEPASVLLQKIRTEKDHLIAQGKIKRDKPLPPITDEEKPFELPAGWEWVRLNALLQKIGAGSTPLGGREVYVSSGVKFLRSQNVWDDGLRLASVAYIKPETHAKMSGTVVVANDLLFNITGASIGRCAVVPGDFDEANVSQHVTILRAIIPTLNAFLHKVLVSRHVQQTVMDVQVGVSREGLSIAKLGQFLIPVPPLAEQTRIVTRVSELHSLCADLRQRLVAGQVVQSRLADALI